MNKASLMDSQLAKLNKKKVQSWRCAQRNSSGISPSRSALYLTVSEGETVRLYVHYVDPNAITVRTVHAIIHKRSIFICNCDRNEVSRGCINTQQPETQYQRTREKFG